MRLNDWKREAERFSDIDRAALEAIDRQAGVEGRRSAEPQSGGTGPEQAGIDGPAQAEPTVRPASPAECGNCHGTGIDPAWPHPPCVCPVGLALREELEQSEPSPGRCAHCPREGEVWYVKDRWLCWKCREGA